MNDDLFVLVLFLLAVGVLWYCATHGWLDELDFDVADRDDEPELSDDELDRVRGK